MSDKIKCEVCGEEVHAISKHLEEAHPEMTLADYRAAHPDAPIYSDMLLKRMRERKEAKAKTMTTTAGKAPLHEVFDIPENTKGVKGTKTGAPIMIEVMDEIPEGFEDYFEPIDPNYIFNIDYLKTAVLGLESNIPTYLVGHAGTGKSTIWEQICTRTRRAMTRIQHTINTEESHILGQYVVKGGETVWEPGPLQLAMKFGLVYLADEYDRAMPQVLSVYQPVLEGKALVTKEAPPEWRVIRPHKDFRFAATGNTNGAGDETGLYPSTALQDFANYERFGLMVQIDWPEEKQEISIIAGQAKIPAELSKKLVKFAKEVRREVDAHTISSPVSPRALINAGIIGRRMGRMDTGLQLAYANRLGGVDKEAVEQLIQRHFGQ